MEGGKVEIASIYMIMFTSWKLGPNLEEILARRVDLRCTLM